MKQILFFLLASQVAIAVPTFECRVRGDGLSGAIRLVDKEVGALELWVQGKRYHCPLKVTGLDAQPGGVLSQIILKMQREACLPELGESVSRKLFDDIRLRLISGKSKVSFTARTQWLRLQQPEMCEIQNVNWKKLLSWAREWENGKS